MAVGLLLGASVAGAQPFEAAVETTRGERLTLAPPWDGPVVVFYEDHDGAKVNQALKDALGVHAPATRVLAIASVEGLGWSPARELVVAAVRDVEQASGLAVYLDFGGALKRRPWGLPGRGSSVLVLDPAGALLFVRTGALSEQDVAEVLGLLTRLVET